MKLAEGLHEGVRTGFSIKYNATKSNAETHSRFMDYSRMNTDNVYITAIKQLLDREDEYNYLIGEIIPRLQDMEQKVASLDKGAEEKAHKGPATFGGD